MYFKKDRLEKKKWINIRFIIFILDRLVKGDFCEFKPCYWNCFSPN